LICWEIIYTAATRRVATLRKVLAVQVCPVVPRQKSTKTLKLHLLIGLRMAKRDPCIAFVDQVARCKLGAHDLNVGRMSVTRTAGIIAFVVRVHSEIITGVQISRHSLITTIMVITIYN
jgi:hypothetical protein